MFGSSISKCSSSYAFRSSAKASNNDFPWAICSCYVKFKGLNPRFHVFFVVLLFSNSFLSFEDKNPSSAIFCSPFYVKLFLLYFSIKKSDTVIGGGLIFIRSPTRMGHQLVGVGLLCVWHLCSRILLFHSKIALANFQTPIFQGKEQTGDML